MGFDAATCSHCTGSSAVYRCKECEGHQLLCQRCIVSSHKYNGLHVIEKWNGICFEFTTLKSLGVRFQLGHPFGETCPSPKNAPDNDFVVIHVNGIHEVSVDFCGCYEGANRAIQVLRYGWFPATPRQPRTAATLMVLRHFQMHSFESKCSGFEFYQSLTRLGDNTGIRPARDRLRSFMTMIREYRHIKTLKRAGRAYDERGIIGTKPGECAVLCSACPQPGRNMPAGWDTRPEKERWLNRLFLAMDANFRLKRRVKSSENVDPSLNKGWAYFVDHEPYMEHIQQFSDQSQAKSTCSSHSAVNNNRLSEGFSVSGVGSVGCARHDCMRPCAIGDLQKGERYANMDYLFLSSLSQKQLQELIDIVLSYDIACQWAINLVARMRNYSKSIQMDEAKIKSITYLVPKFHLPAHISRCQTQYSFNLHKWVGRTDGEAPERGWSHINPIALSTCEMGPGSRRDTLDDHLGDWNWKKTYTMGATLLRRIIVAVSESANQTILFHRFDLGLRSQPKLEKLLRKWEKELITWENDRDQSNPFEERVKKPSQDAVRRALAEEDKKAQQAGKLYALHTLFSASEFIAVGLDLEEQQRRLQIDFKSLGLHVTNAQKSKYDTKCNGLHRRMVQWAEAQRFYMPSTDPLFQDQDMASEPWDLPLNLPSSLSLSLPCDPRLQDLEWRLRAAQAYTALDELRRSLRLRAYLYIDKDKYSRGQAQNTRSNTLIQGSSAKVSFAAAKYRIARLAIAALSNNYSDTTWEREFPVLADTDIRSLQVEPDTNTNKEKRRKTRPSEGKRTISWIWGVLSDNDSSLDNEELQDDLRIEWCKSRARAKRWQEEILLLQEEMKRVLLFLENEATTWKSRAAFQQEERSTRSEGMHAYAFQQAMLREELKAHFQTMWKGVDELVRLKGKVEETSRKTSPPMQTIDEEDEMMDCAEDEAMDCAEDT
ncbi:hypothetical protein BDN72DRAFT_779845 [Pluteus cervinus]|uniref:Uncharacterized protein n=1 Tax=Pluteus cervinus TaxID=181527 RepID=A0ACD3A2L0_9AGAR|nr:hypothetical protein BDN72DRAFT_779845 [Pluteus cervinus]